MSSVVRPSPQQMTRRVVVLAAAAFAIVVPVIQMATGLGLDQGEFAAQGDGTLRVAGYAFSIWGLIYLGILAYAVRQVLPQTGESDLIRRMGVPVRDVLREKGTPYAELGLGDLSLTDDQLLDAMMAHPILINRPIVVSPLGVKLCRPSEEVLDLLPARQRGAFNKEDGENVIDDAGNRIGA